MERKGNTIKPAEKCYLQPRTSFRESCMAATGSSSTYPLPACITGQSVAPPRGRRQSGDAARIDAESRYSQRKQAFSDCTKQQLSPEEHNPGWSSAVRLVSEVMNGVDFEIIASRGLLCIIQVWVIYFQILQKTS